MALRRLTNAVKPAYVKFQHPITKATVYFNTGSFRFFNSSVSWELRSPCGKIHIRKVEEGIKITIIDREKRNSNLIHMVPTRNVKDRTYYNRVIEKYLL